MLSGEFAAAMQNSSMYPHFVNVFPELGFTIFALSQTQECEEAL
mgnify:FL=1